MVALSVFPCFLRHYVCPAQFQLCSQFHPAKANGNFICLNLLFAGIVNSQNKQTL